MTKTQLFKKIIKEFWFFVLSYFTSYLFPKIKEAFLNSKEQFLEYLWSSIKEDFKLNIEEVIKHVENFFKSTTYELKEKIIVDSLFEKVKLPVVLRPFKALLKKILKDKIHAFIKENLEKVHKKLDEII